LQCAGLSSVNVSLMKLVQIYFAYYYIGIFLIAQILKIAIYYFKILFLRVMKSRSTQNN